MCLYPRLIKNRKYTANKKNGGIIPAVFDERTLYVPIGCGKCIECMKQKTRNWQVRLNEEIKKREKCEFVTLTFNNEALEKLTAIAEKECEGINIEENIVATIAVRRFLERWRKKYKKSVKHWLVTELGHNGTERIHLHGIIWTEKKEEIERIWQYGWVYVGKWVNEQTINYIVKYINKIDLEHKGYEPKILTSAGIGANYINKSDSKKNKYAEKETKEYYTTKKGTKLNLPIYYRNKIYSEKERELLWLQKLNKKTRYVLGVEVNEEDYEKTLEYAQIRNKKLGYGDLTNNWDKSEYKKQRSVLKIKRRLKIDKYHIEKEKPKEINPIFAIDNSINEFNS